MPSEIEVKFLNVDIEDIRSRLKAAGAHLEQPMRLMRRDQFDHADQRYKTDHYSERLRIRDEGDKLTITYKKSSPDTNYPNELETTIGSYETTKELLTAVGLQSFSYQESKRETWQLEGVEVVIDEWPWLKPYIEIEGPAETDIKQAASKLGFDWVDSKFGSVDTAYMAQYPRMTKDDSIGEVPELKFDQPMPEFLKERL